MGDSRREERAGIPLSVKLMLTTSIVVAAAVAASASFGASRPCARLAAEDAADPPRPRQRRDHARVGAARRATSPAAAAIPLAQQAYGEVGPLLAADDPRVPAHPVGGDRHPDRRRGPRQRRARPPVDFSRTSPRHASPRARLRRARAGGRRPPRLDLRHRHPPRRRAWSASSAWGCRPRISTTSWPPPWPPPTRAPTTRPARCGSWRSLLLAVGVVLAALLGISTGAAAAPARDPGRSHRRRRLDQRVPDGRRDELGVLARDVQLDGRRDRRAAGRAGAEGVAREGDGARAPGAAGDAAAARARSARRTSRSSATASRRRAAAATGGRIASCRTAGCCSSSATPPATASTRR